MAPPVTRDRGPALPLFKHQVDWIEDRSRFKHAVKCRQSGFSTAASLEAVDDSVDPSTRDNWIILSAGERLAKEFSEKCAQHVQAWGVAAKNETSLFEGTTITQHTIALPTGVKIINLPANPDTARGFTGNVIIDEAGFVRDLVKIWQAVFAMASTGNLKVRVISTPNGAQGKYFEQSKMLGLADGVPPEVLPVRKKGWSGHWVDIYTAAANGMNVDVEALKEAIGDEDTWLQEFCCVFLSDALNYLPMELIQMAESVDASLELPPDWRPKGPLYFGYDVARRRHLAVNAIVEKLGDTLWTRAVIPLKRQKFSVQEDLIRETARMCLRGCIDSTGIGERTAEMMVDEFGSKVEAVTFTGPVKQDLAQRLKGLFEERQIRIPDDRELRRDLNAVKKFTTVAGNVRFDADSTDRGHADRFWALGLAAHAADEGGIPPAEHVSSGQRRAFARAEAY